MAVSQDATSGWYVPATGAEWTELLAGTGLANPTSLWLCQELSGDLIDVIGAFDLAPFNTPLYDQAVAGWSRKAVGTVDATAGQAFENLDAGLPDPATTSIALFAYLAVTSTPAASRGLMRIGNGVTCHLRMTATPRFQLVNGTGTAGTSVPGVGVHPTLMISNQTLDAPSLYNDQEEINDGWASPSGKRISIGANDISAADARYLYLCMWSGASAEFDDAGAATLLDRLQNGPASTGVINSLRPPLLHSLHIGSPLIIKTNS